MSGAGPLHLGRDFRRLWAAMIVSSVGDWMGILAIAAFLVDVGGPTRGALAVTVVMVVRLVTVLVAGPLAGLAADRWPRLGVMAVSDVLRAGAYVAIVLSPGLVTVALASVVIEAGSLGWSGSRDAILPTLVGDERLPTAQSIAVGTAYGTMPLGAALFAVFAWLGRPWPTMPQALPLLADAGTFLVSGALVWTLSRRCRPAQRPPDDRAPVWSSRAAVEGLSVIRHDPVLRSTCTGVLLAVAALGSLISLGPLFTRFALGSDDTALGVLVVGVGLGLLGGVAVAGPLGRRGGTLPATSVAGGCATVALLGLSVATGAAVPVALAVAVGVAGGVGIVNAYVTMQRRSPDHVRGRVMTSVAAGSRVALLGSRAVFPLLSAGVSGLGAAGGVGPRVAVAAASVLTGCATAAFLRGSRVNA